ncbi:carbohydrate sulfotransferase 15-like isoform X2 [Apostichopus japonicus]|uniref:carbohydrate sulfotransferase 15-like isoform X2 n=1 Tax=Stichopus japonicus TaxID=307972 RepID=UPI003AB37066
METVNLRRKRYISVMGNKIFEELPITFLPEYKNPCYLRDNSTDLICLPYALLLGLPKCGTTDLYRKMLSHPDIISIRKEVQWLARASRRGSPLRHYGDKIFTPAIRRLIGKGRRKDQAITVDGSASTYWDNEGWLAKYPKYFQKGPPYILADVIKALLPDAKLMVIFREPASRLYSDYVFFNKLRNISPENFHELVRTSIDEYKACLTSRGSEYACVYQSRPARLQIGLYSLYTRDWLLRYPRQQFMFINLSNWHKGCRQILPEIYEFLGAEKLTEIEINAICMKSKSNTNAIMKDEAGPMLNETRSMLREFYRPYVIELADILHDNSFLWDYTR